MELPALIVSALVWSFSKSVTLGVVVYFAMHMSLVFYEGRKACKTPSSRAEPQADVKAE
jgi:hypothetical protein